MVRDYGHDSIMGSGDSSTKGTEGMSVSEWASSAHTR